MSNAPTLRPWRARVEAAPTSRAGPGSCCCSPTAIPTPRSASASIARRKRSRPGRLGIRPRASAGCVGAIVGRNRASDPAGRGADFELDAQTAHGWHDALVDASAGRSTRCAAHDRGPCMETRWSAAASVRARSAIDGSDFEAKAAEIIGLIWTRRSMRLSSASMRRRHSSARPSRRDSAAVARPRRTARLRVRASWDTVPLRRAREADLRVLAEPSGALVRQSEARSAGQKGITSETDLARKLRRFITKYNERAKPVRWAYVDPVRRIPSTLEMIDTVR